MRLKDIEFLRFAVNSIQTYSESIFKFTKYQTSLIFANVTFKPDIHLIFIWYISETRKISIFKNHKPAQYSSKIHSKLPVRLIFVWHSFIMLNSCNIHLIHIWKKNNINLHEYQASLTFANVMLKLPVRLIFIFYLIFIYHLTFM